MELLQLRYFCEIAKEENISKASKVLHVAQPSLSRSLACLEEELGTKLFEREGRKLRLNHKGELYYKNIRNALGIIDNAKSELLDNCAMPCGHLTLVILAGSNIVPELLVEFHKHYPHISLNLKQQTSHNIQQVRDFDFVISATPGDYKGLTNITLLEEDIVIAADRNHPLAVSSEISHSEDNKDCYITSYREIDLIEAKPYQFVSYSKGPSIRDLIDHLCEMAGFMPDIVLESDSPDTFKSFVQSKVGIALLPYQTHKSFFTPMITPIFIKSPVCKRTIFLSYPEDQYLSNASKRFMEFCVDFFSKIR
ncbi:LysR family transcriptional regulator [Butyrivibrio sp. JL13D10]|uniref:LysR family transcriptional regulator n=1 Tax=Butyrivibrio sp. JL13D10 TaxID=3236815 RepID=UPI0038B6AA4E